MRDVEIVTSNVIFREAIRQLRDSGGGAVYRSLGRYDDSAGHHLLVQAKDASEGEPRLAIQLGGEVASLPTIPVGCSAILAISRDGGAIGRAEIDGKAHAICRMVLRGPGMHMIDLLGDETDEEPTTAYPGEGRFSRTIGALGGQDVFRRLQRNHYGLFACGRIGSHVADHLARNGAERLTLIDPDIVEEHNIAEMALVTTENVGQKKVSAVARELRKRYSTTVVEVPYSVTSLQSLHSIRSIDVAISSADHDGARLAAQCTAIFGAVLIDIGTGIVGSGADREMGADVSLHIPGESCILCRGLANEAEAIRMLLGSAQEERRIYASRPHWRVERMGSLASWNQTAIAVSLRTLEDFLAQRINRSTWVRLFFDPIGRLETVYPDFPPHLGSCPLCRLAFTGNAGLARIRRILEDWIS